MTEDKEDKVQDTNEEASSSEKEIADLKALVEKHKNDYLYLRAEFDNYKKHAIKERADLMKFAGERLAVDLLNVLDNFERALSTQVTPESFKDFYKGVELTANELKSTLSKHGISEVPALNSPFDPAVHEALSSEENTDVTEGHVCRVFKKPYKYHDKLLRVGQVIVAKKPGN